jgi:hypothetical protein
MGSDLKGRVLKPDNKHLNKLAFTQFIPLASILKNEILSPGGSVGGWLQMGKADANLDFQVGRPLFLAISNAEIDTVNSGDPTGLAALRGVIEGVDTSLAALHDPVYLSETAGAWTLTPPSTPENIRRIGSVLKVDAVNGEIMFDGAMDHGTVLAGSATIPNGSTSVVVAVGTRFNGRLAVVSFAEDPGSATAIWAGPVAGGNLTITVDLNPGTDVDVHYLLKLV